MPNCVEGLQAITSEVVYLTHCLVTGHSMSSVTMATVTTASEKQIRLRNYTSSILMVNCSPMTFYPSFSAGLHYCRLSNQFYFGREKLLRVSKRGCSFPSKFALGLSPCEYIVDCLFQNTICW
jgi:hypothetical protein